ncbi:phosphate signaling complex protein PhoU [Candidatus Thorarchaeota archaeon]|nr:MAG: phosphate signaling complex protein PhoU [Candidatus Thorarchaeota archaeon]
MSRKIEFYLDGINKKARELTNMATSAFIDSMKAFKDLDQDLAAEVRHRSDEIEVKARSIEENVFETIARRQPVARDLRELATYLQVSQHLYRIGRYAYKIAHIVRLCEGMEHFKELISLPHLADLAKQTIDIAMRGVLDRDLSGIDELEKLEAESDKETSEMFEEITEYLRKRNDITTMAMYYMIIGRYCERAADHAFSIAERAIFMVKGERTKLGLAYQGTSNQAPH